MALFDTYGVKLAKDKPFMTESERQAFKTLRDGENISFFRVGFCESCKAEVPKSKRFCSEKCWKKEEKT